MPEGDLIFRAARTLHRALAGHVVTRFETGYAHLSRVNDDAPIAGRTITKCESAGKHLLICFSGDLVLRTHMRMNGSWHLYRQGERWWRNPRDMRVRIDTAEWVAIAFNVPVAEFVSERELRRRGPVAALGPDLLAGVRRDGSSAFARSASADRRSLGGGWLDPPELNPPAEGGSKDPPLRTKDPPLPTQFDRAEALRRMRVRGTESIARTLLDQRVIAGIGNIFKSEVLFLAGVHPDTPVSSLDDVALGKILDVAETLLRANVLETSGTMITTVRGLRQRSRSAGPDERLYVYGRKGRPCRRCGTPISSSKTGVEARPTYWCPKCQTLSGVGSR